MAPMPINRAQTTAVLKRLPINRIAANTLGQSKAGASRIARALLTNPPTPAGAEPKARSSRVGSSYDTEWARSYPARAARLLLLNAVMKPVVDLVATPTIIGADRLDDVDGPVIFAANHHSHADTPLMMTAIPEPWRNRLFIGAAADYWFTNRITSPLSALVIGAIPVERHKISRVAIDTSIELLRDGWSMLIFPEGARSPDGWAQEFTAGAAFLSAHAGVPVVPVYLRGTDRVMPKGRSFPKPAPTTVVFGSPIMATADEDSRAFARRIERNVSMLADEHATDWWQAQKRAAASDTPSLQGPPAGSWRRAWAQQDRRDRSARRTWPRV